MTKPSEYSANEIEALVLKAARGGGLPLGLAEDLSMAIAYLDLDRLSECPCHENGAAFALPKAIDLVAAGHGPQTVTADHETIAAYISLVEHQTQQTLVWEATPTGGVFQQFEQGGTDTKPPLGRRVLPAVLSAHLFEMAAKTLVPETEASRLGGAGAGLTDND